MAQIPIPLLLLVSSIVSSVSWASPLCRTPDPTPAEIAEVEARLAESPGPPPTTPVTVRVYFHVIHSGPAGMLTASQIDDSIAVLNAAYAGETRFSFALADSTYSDNASWYDDCDLTSVETAMKASLRQGSAADLNIYSCGMTGSGLLGWATFPNWYAANPQDDGVVVLDESLPGGSAVPYNQGDTATHEVGHWLGLYHTYQGGCAGAGDQVQDTPAEAGPTFDCVIPVDSCPVQPGFDPFHNYMDFSSDACRLEFTEGQAIRESDVWETYRATLPSVPVGGALPLAILLGWTGLRLLRRRMPPQGH